MTDGPIVFDTPEGIDFYFLAVRASALSLQAKTGLKHSRGSVLKFCKQKYGIKGTRLESAAAQMEAMVDGARQAHKRVPNVHCTYTDRVQIEAFIRGAAMAGLELPMPTSQILRMIPWDNEEKTTKTITWSAIE